MYYCLLWQLVVAVAAEAAMVLYLAVMEVWIFGFLDWSRLSFLSRFNCHNSCAVLDDVRKHQRTILKRR